MIRELCKDTRGGVISTELVLLASAVGAGVLAGTGHLRVVIEREFAGLAQSLQTKRLAPATIPFVQASNPQQAKPQGIELFVP